MGDVSCLITPDDFDRGLDADLLALWCELLPRLTAVIDAGGCLSRERLGDHEARSALSVEVTRMRGDVEQFVATRGTLRRNDYPHQALWLWATALASGSKAHRLGTLIHERRIGLPDGSAIPFLVQDWKRESLGDVGRERRRAVEELMWWRATSTEPRQWWRKVRKGAWPGITLIVERLAPVFGMETPGELPEDARTLLDSASSDEPEARDWQLIWEQGHPTFLAYDDFIMGLTFLWTPAMNLREASYTALWGLARMTCARHSLKVALDDEELIEPVGLYGNDEILQLEVSCYGLPKETFEVVVPSFTDWESSLLRGACAGLAEREVAVFIHQLQQLAPKLIEKWEAWLDECVCRLRTLAAPVSDDTVVVDSTCPVHHNVIDHWRLEDARRWSFWRTFFED